MSDVVDELEADELQAAKRKCQRISKLIRKRDDLNRADRDSLKDLWRFLNSNGIGSTEIARLSGLTKGAVNLVLNPPPEKN